MKDRTESHLPVCSLDVVSLSYLMNFDKLYVCIYTQLYIVNPRSNPYDPRIAIVTYCEILYFQRSIFVSTFNITFRKSTVSICLVLVTDAGQ